MCCNCIVKIFVKNNMSTSVGPASNIDGNADCGWMSCCILDMNTHNGIFATHTLRSKSDFIDTVFKQFLHRSCTFIFIVTAKWSHQRFL